VWTTAQQVQVLPAVICTKTYTHVLRRRGNKEEAKRPDSSVTSGSFMASPTRLVIFLGGGADDAGVRTVIETFT
jgi:hypothetical protein